MASAVRIIGITVVAAAAGACAALLLAPQSGERTRRQIGRKMERCAQDVRDDLQKRAHDLYCLGTETASDVVRVLVRNNRSPLASVLSH